MFGLSKIKQHSFNQFKEKIMADNAADTQAGPGSGRGKNWWGLGVLFVLGLLLIIYMNKETIKGWFPNQPQQTQPALAPAPASALGAKAQTEPEKAQKAECVCGTEKTAKVISIDKQKVATKKAVAKKQTEDKSVAGDTIRILADSNATLVATNAKLVERLGNSSASASASATASAPAAGTSTSSSGQSPVGAGGEICRLRADGTARPKNDPGAGAYPRGEILAINVSDPKTPNVKVIPRANEKEDCDGWRARIAGDIVWKAERPTK